MSFMEFESARDREKDSYVFDKTSELRSQVVECLQRAGIEGRILDNVRDCKYDHRLEREVRCSAKVDPNEVTKRLVNEELGLFIR